MIVKWLEKKYPERYQNEEYKRLKFLQIALSLSLIIYLIVIIMGYFIEYSFDFSMGGLMVISLIILISMTIRIRNLEDKIEDKT